MLFIHYQTLSVSLQSSHDGVSIGKNICLHLLDEVKVWIGGDMRPSQSRLPELRFILAAPSSTMGHCALDQPMLGGEVKEYQPMLGGEVKELVLKDLSTSPSPTTTATASDDDNFSLYSVLHATEVNHLSFPPPALAKIRHGSIKNRNKNKSKVVANREEITRGRCSFGGFRSIMNAQSGNCL